MSPEWGRLSILCIGLTGAAAFGALFGWFAVWVYAAFSVVCIIIGAQAKARDA